MSMSTTEITWHIRLMGGLRIESGETVLTRFRSQRAAALVAYLALFPQRSHSREELAELFWPDADPEAGRANLRASLLMLRRSLEPEGVPEGSVILANGRQHIALNRERIWLDVAEFEAALQAAGRVSGGDPAEQTRHRERAVALYGGPLLPGVYEPWALTERDRLAEAHLNTLTDLCAHYEQAGDPAKALDYARRAVTADPLSETAHAAVIRLLVASGQYAGARRQYGEVERLLREQLGIEPSAATRALLLRTPAEANPAPSIRASVFTATAAPRGTALAALEAETQEEEGLTPHTPRPKLPSPPPAPPTTRLPLNLTRFFGRTEELMRLTSLLAPSPLEDEGAVARLVTITGLGGAGKTRLAIETARAVAAHYPGGVRFAPLADLTDPARVPSAVAEALGVIRAPHADPSDTVAAALAGGPPTLLVLDNFEHLAEGGGAMAVAELLARTQNLSLLVTSRQRLFLDGEQEVSLPPLPAPALPGTPERLLEFPSIQLFVDRARSSNPHFALASHNAETVAELCRRLEGSPLALELCAAWAQTLTPAQMLARLAERRFDLLVSRRRDCTPRHHTLRAAIAWSYSLLRPEVQALFRSLAVFAGSWDLRAAEVVCDEPRALEILTELRAHSLLLTEEVGEEIRFRQQEMLREFAREQLSPEERVRLEERYARHFLARAEEENIGFAPGEDATLRLARREADHDNTLAALRWFREAPGQAEAEEGLRLICLLQHFWYVRGHVEEGLREAEALLARPEASQRTRVRAHALLSTAALAKARGLLDEAERRCKEGLEIFREAGEPKGAADALCNLGLVLQTRGEHEAAALPFRESLELYREAGDDASAAHALKCLGSNALDRGDTAMARAHFEASARLYADHGDEVGRNMMLGERGRLALVEGDLERASALLNEHLALSQRLKVGSHAASALWLLARVAQKEGKHELALSRLGQALALRRSLGEQHGAAHLLIEMARLAEAQGDEEAARRYATEALPTFVAQRDRSGVPATLNLLTFGPQGTAPTAPGQAVRLLAAVHAATAGASSGWLAEGEAQTLIARLREALGEVAFLAAWEEGAHWSRHEAARSAASFPPVAVPTSGAGLNRYNT